MHREEHIRSSVKHFGIPSVEIHEYLDSYFPYFRSEAHRIVLHHRKGVEKAACLFASICGSFDLAYNIAIKHIEDDMGFVAASWKELAPHVLFLHEREYNDAVHFLNVEFPLDEIKLKGNLYY